MGGYFDPHLQFDCRQESGKANDREDARGHEREPEIRERHGAEDGMRIVANKPLVTKSVVASLWIDSDAPAAPGGSSPVKSFFGLDGGGL
ncbi:MULTISPECIES: hypothetical protein [Prauserella]|uniref:Uncharacterized protein n=1 Tax=Prauserella endophytica TaxID=1592324 RepID=A0ABY2RSC1_9PSEU|nr:MULTISPECIES: hypothetical protein [Prauserella]TKG58259.1 hypothetical protein FCN18_38245 [Prauserella endophytica]